MDEYRFQTMRVEDVQLYTAGQNAGVKAVSLEKTEPQIIDLKAEASATGIK